MEPRRIHPRQIQDKFYLSRLFDELLKTLENSALQVDSKTLSFDTQIPEHVLERLRNLHRNPQDALHIHARDYHVIFPHILIRYPTVRMFELPDGSFFFQL
ncbi:MAG: hypothetical protein NZM43_09350 [Saprospiraceae bacterium]|nr:hypothetical protein [Saprospiraceae bacterium]MDW8484520.1 hypothetical protein [Saprospiraceae bacterium]